MIIWWVYNAFKRVKTHFKKSDGAQLVVVVVASNHENAKNDIKL